MLIWHQGRVLTKVPDAALPAAIGAAEDVAVGGESFLWHGATPFLNHQHYPRGCGNVQTYVLCYAEKNFPAFWWFYTCLGRGVFTGLFFVYCDANFEVGYPP